MQRHPPGRKPNQEQMSKLIFALLFVLFTLSKADYFISEDDKEEKNKYTFQTVFAQSNSGIVMVQIRGPYVVFASDQNYLTDSAERFMRQGNVGFVRGTLYRTVGIWPKSKSIKWDAFMYKEDKRNEHVKSSISAVTRLKRSLLYN